jgi:hypothetical protein
MFAENSSTYGGHHGIDGVVPPNPLWTLWTLLKYFLLFEGRVVRPGGPDEYGWEFFAMDDG